MNEREARMIADGQLARYRERSYADLQRLLGCPDTFEIPAPSGARYQVEVEAFWDGNPKGDLRVMVVIDDGGLRAFAPLSNDFIMSPDGRFVGEQRGKEGV